MILNCCVIDDNPASIRLVKQYTEKTEFLYFSAGETDPLAAFEKIRENKIIADIIFLDIEMPRVSGFEILEELSHLAVVILISGHRDFAEDAFEKGASGYLYKPFGYEKFMAAIMRAKEIHQARKPISFTPPLPYYYIPGNGREVRIRLKTEDVWYIEAAANFSIIHFVNGTTHLCYLTLKQLESLLPLPHFIRINRSILVNMAKVVGYDAYDIHLENDRIFPFGEKYKNEFVRQIRNSGMLY
ncbi:LytR/AlgR family response regulator transcription factor [Pedobacter helvus]|uniref:LytR/AlgR family response regulator transcription factor n=1 Tax=Pedobacter helvus TaxID=2563444 RepID=A0ABW9JCL6_9SPHI|nr:response regulator [Pedobacter ureilyticus]